MRILPSVLLCGYERGGTTLLSELFAQNGYQSGFEVGVLMCESPSDFPTYKPYNENVIAGWRIDRAALPDMCSGSFEDFYEKLINNSKSVSGDTGDKYFDKTPIYMSQLGKCLNRTRFINKAVVITRDPRGIFTSWANRRKGKRESTGAYIKSNLSTFVARYLRYFIGSVAHRSNPNVMFVPLEGLCLDFEHYQGAIGQFVDGKRWTKFEAKPRFDNTYGNVIDPSKAFGYENDLSPKIQRLILEKTRLASRYFGNLKDQYDYMEDWKSLESRMKTILRDHGIKNSGQMVNDTYLEPETYMLRYPELIYTSTNPIEHFKNFGAKDGWNPA